MAANDPDIFTYLRTGTKQFLIVTNISQKVRTLSLPKKIWQKNWQLVIANDKTAPRTVTQHMKINPYDAWLFEQK